MPRAGLSPDLKPTAEVLIAYAPELYRMVEEFDLDTVELHGTSSTIRVDGALGPFAVSSAEEFQSGVVGEDRVGPCRAGDEVSVWLEPLRIRSRGNGRGKTALDGNDPPRPT